MLPATYINASAHNVTPLCPVRGRLGVGLQLEGGEVLRLALTEQSAAFLLKALADYVAHGNTPDAPQTAQGTEAGVANG